MTREEFRDLTGNDTFNAEMMRYLNGDRQGISCHAIDDARAIQYSDFFQEFMDMGAD